MIEKLEQRKENLSKAFSAVYNVEIGRFEELKVQNRSDFEKIPKMDLVWKELSAFMDKNPQERVINKINDISDFVSHSNEELEQIKNYNQNANNPDRDSLKVNSALKVIALNVDKMISIVNKFSVKPPKLGQRANAESPYNLNSQPTVELISQ